MLVKLDDRTHISRGKMHINMIRKKKFLIIVLAPLVYFLADFTGLISMLCEMNYFTEFKYPIEGDITKYVESMERGKIPNVDGFNNHFIHFVIKNKGKCVKDDNSDNASLQINVVYLVRSSIVNIDNRNAIRDTWGNEKQFSNVEIRTVFLLGSSNEPTKMNVQNLIEHENEEFHDIIQGDFADTYYSSTNKTLMGMRWAVEFCSSSQYYLFVDDDYYVSARNLIIFLRNPFKYPTNLKDKHINIDIANYSGRGNSDDNLSFSQATVISHQDVKFHLPHDVILYAGFVFPSSNPHRHKISKWYISLEEYPYSRYPPYVTGGARLFSNKALKLFYYATHFVKLFKFDDVYLGIVAKKLNITPFHSDEFWFCRKLPYNENDFRYTIASHGFNDATEMKMVWNHQKQAGNA